MNETQAVHTPGPWTVLADDDGLLCIVGQDDGGDVIVAEIILNVPSDEANARLIAAAPVMKEINAQLLAALELQADVDCLAEIIGTSDITGIVAIVEKYPGLLHQDMAEETAYNLLWRETVTKREAAITAAKAGAS